jgi:hypothetical protein
MILLLHSPLEAFGLLLRCRIELFVVSTQLTLPSIVFAFDGLPFALPVQNKFRMYSTLQFHELHVLKNHPHTLKA